MWNLRPSPKPDWGSTRGLAAALAMLLPGLGGFTDLASADPAEALEPPAVGGVAAVDRALARLSSHRRLLVVGAHPDDEDTRVLALVGRGWAGEAAYLSLTRGEGGQNLIGPELGVGLGLIRSHELLAARRIDGARQYFSRAYDFGYTRSLEETFERWPREALLEDVVRAVRRFRPQVILSVFPGKPFPTHGQHQAAGVIAHEAFREAGEIGAFPGLVAEGLPPWRPAALYQSAWWNPKAASLRPSLATIEPHSGKSIFQLSMAARSMHRSQDMGRLQELGAQTAGLLWVEGAGGPEAGDLFEGIDTSPAAMAATLPPGAVRDRVMESLSRVESLARELRSELVPSRLAQVLPGLLEIVGELDRALEALVSVEDELEIEAVRRLVEEKSRLAEQASAAAAGVVVDALAERETWIPGETTSITARVWNAGSERVEVSGISLELGAEGAYGWKVDARSEVAGAGVLAPGEVGERAFDVTVGSGAEPTLPYFLRRPRGGYLYTWPSVAPSVWGEPFGPPLASVGFRLKIQGREVSLDREAVHRSLDQALGEVRRPMRVVPAVEASIEPDLLLWRVSDRSPREIEVRLVSNATAPISGRLEFSGPTNGIKAWPGIEAIPFSLSEEGSVTTLKATVEAPKDLSPGLFHLSAEAVLPDGRRFAAAYPLVDYEHIRPTPRAEEARLAISVVDLELPPLTRVAYLRGAADRVPELLRRVGIPVEGISSRDLAEKDLSPFDAVIVGSRAYETDPGLARANPRLLEYVRQGGLAVVQYQQYAFVEGGSAPRSLTIGRPHGRITDETAPVEILEPGHPVFHFPNVISPGDWDGWVQERGLYFAQDWDPTFLPLLAMREGGEPEQRGALLVGRLGRGHYVYTGLAFFRQLPAGVGGAYRLFANLLALGAGDPEEEEES